MTQPKASSIYIASPEGDTGKSTVALGVMHRLAASVARVGVFRPIARSGESVDYILELLLEQSTADIAYEDCLGVSYHDVHQDPDAAIAQIVDRYHAVAERCDAVVIVGSDYTDVASPSELGTNARIAVNLGAPVLLTIKGFDRTPDEVAALAEVCLGELKAQRAHTAAIVANRCNPDQLDEVRQALARFDKPAWVLPEVPLLVSPSVEELMKAVKGSLVSGDEALLSREATSFMVAGMTAEHCLERLKEGQAVIFPADRSDVLLAVASAHVAEGFPSLSAIILNGGLKLHPRIADLVDGIGLRLPIIETDSGTFETASAAAHARGRVTVASARKIDTALALMDRYVDGADLVAQLAIPIPSVTTPQMFEYQLLDRARDNRKRIVLPEGDDDRILKAAGRLLQRQVADLTILGEEAEIRSRAAELGVDISNALVVSPKTSDLAEKFADQYFELRKHKGMTPDRAREIMRNVSYFGTMLVYNDIVDGMVSGAAHTTAHTIRPAFEVIRTTSGVSTVSSIFLMCLADRVLAYGDCAIVPDPTSEQLADIAISSARTADLVDGIGLRLPIIETDSGTFETASAAAHARGRVTVASARKIDTALALMDRYVDGADLVAQLAIPIPSVTTPQMFEYQLLDRARDNRKRIVLPEGDDDRILKAAGRLLQRQVADLTILGEEAEIRSRAAELGVDISNALVVSPKTSDLAEKFADQYFELRKHKGMTPDRAREIMRNVSYFGTMLVYNDIVDGMVSGAAHTTAHTIRPAFEVIRTTSGVSTVSSIFLMCLADRVLAYGDCAIVPDPTSEQLADIAISSARTAAQFGIDPRVAMLSYSTGSSGSGADVEKVRIATELVRSRQPELLVEGPIQYDAAVEPSVAATKMPDSPVAGRATVLIFPDLNTGNNTYKAVQRSAGAIAIGPVLQGLRKPINDLSRGALVEDIVNTVAITAIQAQERKQS
ncbi:Probable phosphate acetyltransferase (PTA) [Mycobacteroides abscessus subsp. abscessus]|nr:phosphate acetyltransferase [Mycobacteroides abscessus]SHW68096.1 Probable phosphate acetyltransferase (PTA) [Mycobacteroides abscessus subsp. abscessus]